MPDSSLGEPKTESPFWRFSLRFYALPGVAPACVVVQDEADADVNLLLLLLFLAERGAVVTPEEVARLDGAIGSWRDEVVKPLRALRRHLKTGVGSVPIATSEGLRSQIKRVELESERIEQGILEAKASDIAGKGVSRENAARENLEAYAAYLGPLPENALQILLSAFSEAPPLASGS